LAFFTQYYEIYQNNRRFSDLSFALKKVLALQITHLMIHNFCQHNKALTLSEIATQLMIPIAVIQPVLSALIASQLIVEFKPEDEDSELYQPAVDINKLTIVYVIDALEHCGQNDLPDSPQELLFMTAVDHFKSLIEASEQNYLLKNITSDTLYRKNNIACGSCVVS
jgi:membrane protein